MELPYQTLKNLSEKLLKGRGQTSRGAIETLDRCLSEYAEEIIEEAVGFATMMGKKRVSAAHVERAVAVLKRR